MTDCAIPPTRYNMHTYVHICAPCYLPTGTIYINMSYISYTSLKLNLHDLPALARCFQLKLSADILTSACILIKACTCTCNKHITIFTMNKIHLPGYLVTIYKLVETMMKKLSKTCHTHLSPTCEFCQHNFV